MKTFFLVLQPGTPRLRPPYALDPFAGSAHPSLNSTGRSGPASCAFRALGATFHARLVTFPRECRDSCAKLSPHRREEEDFPQGFGAGEHHHQAVDAEADAAGRRHSLFERLDEGLVEGLGLFVAALALGDLFLEAAPLLVGVVELAEGIGDLDAAGERLPALDQPLLG